MNPTDLQRRLDAVALGDTPETATGQDWERNRALVARRRRRRRLGTGAVAGLAAAAAVALALAWNPPSNDLELVPAQPTDSSLPQARAHLVDPESLAAEVEECRDAADPVYDTQTPTPIFAASSDLADGVLYRFPDGTMRFCTVFSGARADGPVSPQGAASDDPTAEVGAPRRETWASSNVDVGGRTGWVASSFGFVPADVERVVVSTADGQEYEAAVSDGRWWTSVWVPEEAMAQQSSWRAFDASGALVEEGGR